MFDLDTGGKHIRLELKQPILTNTDLEKIRRIEDNSSGVFRAFMLPICYPSILGANGMEGAIEHICKCAEEAVESGHNIIILSDRALDSDHIAVPSLLAVAAVHHHLIREGLRTEVGLVIETGMISACWPAMARRRSILTWRWTRCPVLGAISATR